MRDPLHTQDTQAGGAGCGRDRADRVQGGSLAFGCRELGCCLSAAAVLPGKVHAHAHAHGCPWP